MLHLGVSQPELVLKGTIVVGDTHAGSDVVEMFRECMRPAKYLLVEDSFDTLPLIREERYASAYLVAAFAECQYAERL